MTIVINTRVGKRLNYDIIASKLGCYKYKLIEGELPPGLTLSGGSITGKSQTKGIYSFCIKVYSNDSCERLCFTIRVKSTKEEEENLKPASWVAVGRNEIDGKTIKYSEDGIYWKNSLSGMFSIVGNGVASNENTWIAVGDDDVQGKTIKYSDNGIRWKNSVNGMFSIAGNGVASKGNMWVAVGEDTDGNTIKYSYDHLNWLNASGNMFDVGWGVSYSNDRWVALGSGTSTIQYSDNGIDWTGATGSLFTAAGYRAVSNGSTWVAVGENYPQGGATIKTSVDGILWEDASTGMFSKQGFGIATNGLDRWVGVGVDEKYTIKYSDGDGKTWTGANGYLFKLEGVGVACDGEKWVAVGSDYLPITTIVYSLDGIEWLPANGSLFPDNGGYDVAVRIPGPG